MTQTANDEKPHGYSTTIGFVSDHGQVVVGVKVYVEPLKVTTP